MPQVASHATSRVAGKMDAKPLAAVFARARLSSYGSLRLRTSIPPPPSMCDALPCACCKEPGTPGGANVRLRLRRNNLFLRPQVQPEWSMRSGETEAGELYAMD